MSGFGSSLADNDYIRYHKYCSEGDPAGPGYRSWYDIQVECPRCSCVSPVMEIPTKSGAPERCCDNCGKSLVIPNPGLTAYMMMHESYCEEFGRKISGNCTDCSGSMFSNPAECFKFIRDQIEKCKKGENAGKYVRVVRLLKMIDYVAGRGSDSYAREKGGVKPAGERHLMSLAAGNNDIDEIMDEIRFLGARIGELDRRMRDTFDVLDDYDDQSEMGRRYSMMKDARRDAAFGETEPDDEGKLRNPWMTKEQRQKIDDEIEARHEQQMRWLDEYRRNEEHGEIQAR